MKILELRFKNLNSLYGEWIIDFTVPEYSAGGIFALTGPTGAGKSTILDAVCLALYGATPRLGRITKSGNEIMSRRTGECCSEVVFESQAGRFRCRWEQRRARRKADGKLQDQEHQIADAATGDLLETKKSLVRAVIEEKTGMDFDRFTRSMMLAQGRFDTFLKADIEQKSRILEQITGTEIYTGISRRVHERRSAEQEELRQLETEAAGIRMLEPEDLAALQEGLLEKQSREDELAGLKKQTDAALRWLQDICGLESELEELRREEPALEEEWNRSRPQRDRLAQAEKAASLMEDFTALKGARDRLRDLGNRLEREMDALPALEKDESGGRDGLKDAAERVVRAKDSVRNTAPVIRDVRLLDETMVRLKQDLVQRTEAHNGSAEKLKSSRRELDRVAGRRKEAERTLDAGSDYLREHGRDEWLVEGLAGVQERLSRLSSMHSDILRLKERLHSLQKTRQQWNGRLGTIRMGKEALEESCREVSRTLLRHDREVEELLQGRLLREYRSVKEAKLREQVLLNRIVQLEDLRLQLEDGRPCPLCGSEHHPYAEGQILSRDELDEEIASLTGIIEKGEDLEVRRRGLDDERLMAAEQLKDCESRLVLAEKGLETAARDSEQASEELEQQESGFGSLKERVLTELNPLGISDIPDHDVSALTSLLEGRLRRWKTQVEQDEAIRKHLTELDAEILRLNAVMESQTEDVRDRKESLDQADSEYSESSRKRRELFGERNPDEEERRLQQDLENAELAEKEADTRLRRLQTALTESRTRIAGLKKDSETIQTEVGVQQDGFAEILQNRGFRDEAHFKSSLLEEEPREALSRSIDRLKQRRSSLKAKKEDRLQRLNNEKSRLVTTESRDVLTERQNRQDQELKEIQAKKSELTFQLEENRRAAASLKDRQEVIHAARTEYRKWDRLHELIGSADGKKFRNFAQGLTFELMVAHANTRLREMTDRYVLIRDDAAPLELNVVDGYQAGETRSTRNLSGGESFIVSLALALGLSRMSSRKVRVDSLFLDEGFGTLDEDALETALETLSGLHQDGKLIGIISHVPALKERIGTRISVSRRSGGKSALSGPGCRGL